MADRLRDYLDGRRLPMDPVGEALGVHPNSLRYAALTGTVLIRWAGARQPTLWTVPRPELSPAQALQQLLSRYLHFSGPSTVDSFVWWGGVDAPAATTAFEALRPSLLTVRTPLGEAQILARDEDAFRAPSRSRATARLLPSGDPYYLLWGADRDLLVPNAAHRAQLWTSRVWPGGLLLNGEIAGTWRRSKAIVDVSPWRRLSPQERAAVEQEATALPLPDLSAPMAVRWDR